MKQPEGRPPKKGAPPSGAHTQADANSVRASCDVVEHDGSRVCGQLSRCFTKARGESVKPHGARHEATTHSHARWHTPTHEGVMSRASVHATADMNHNGDCELRRVGSTSSVAALGRLWRCFLRREVERRPAGALHEATVHERPASAVRPTYACIHTCQGSGATDADTTCCGTGASGRRCPRPNAWRESARRHSRRGRRRHPDGGGGAFSRTPSGPRASLAHTRSHTHALSKAPNCIQESLRGRPYALRTHEPRERGQLLGSCHNEGACTAP